MHDSHAKYIGVKVQQAKESVAQFLEVPVVAIDHVDVLEIPVVDIYDDAMDILEDIIDQFDTTMEIHEDKTWIDL